MNAASWKAHLRERGRDYVVTLTVAVALAFAASSTASFARDVYLRQQDATDWFEYYGLTYVGEAPDGRAGLGSLRMESDMTVRRPLELRFHDVLRCRALDNLDGLREFVSQNPNTEAFVAEPYERRTRVWFYNADYLRGRECIVRSTITAEVDGVVKSQTIDSQPFVIEPLG